MSIKHFTIVQVRGNQAPLVYAIANPKSNGRVEIDLKLAKNLLDICRELVFLKINPNFGDK